MALSASGLPYPPPDEEAQTGDQIEAFDAVRLFVERVRRVRPGFSPEEERDDLLRICRLVEGMPLALELAAGWARSLNGAAIAAEIERNLTFLTSNLRNIPQRHRSMQAVFNHSWTLLTPAEQAIFPQLASIAHARGDYEKAQAHARDAYAACQQTGDRWFMAYCLNEMGRAARAVGDYAAAQRHFEAGYELRESFSDPEGMALGLLNLGDVALRRQESDEAGDLFARSAAIYRQINDRGGLAAAYNGLGKTAVAQEDYETAREQFRRALAIAGDIRFTPLLLAILTAVAQFLLQTNRIEGGLALLALVEAHPAADQETKTAARRQLGRARSAVSPALFAATEKPPDLETAVAAAQTSLAAPIPPPGENTLPPSPPPTALVEPLTERELEVLHLIAQGLTNHQIAERLTVVVGTVKAHNNSIYGKLAVSNRVQATARARELGLIP